MEWQPIETAPKDGTDVLLWGKWAGEVSGPTENIVIDIGFFTDGSSDYAGKFWWALKTGDAYMCWINPTHWMPLPTPPKP